MAVRLKIPLELTELLSFFGSPCFSVKKRKQKKVRRNGCYVRKASVIVGQAEQM